MFTLSLRRSIFNVKICRLQTSDSISNYATRSIRMFIMCIYSVKKFTSNIPRLWPHGGRIFLQCIHTGLWMGLIINLHIFQICNPNNSNFFFFVIKNVFLSLAICYAADYLGVDHKLSKYWLFRYFWRNIYCSYHSQIFNVSEWVGNCTRVKIYLKFSNRNERKLR